MRIYDRNLQATAETEAGRAKGAQKTGTGGESLASSVSRSNGDHVEFSNALGRLVQAMSSQEAQRASRVQALAAQYQSGAYHADSLATSRAMISEGLLSGRP